MQKTISKDATGIELKKWYDQACWDVYARASRTKSQNDKSYCIESNERPTVNFGCLSGRKFG